jgi:NAD+ kinase
VRLGIVAQRGNDRAVSLAGAIRTAVAADVWVDETTAAAMGVDGRPVDAFGACDLVVSVGGDGTFLYAAHGAGSPPFVGVFLGEDGLLHAVEPDDAVDTVTDLVDAAADGGLTTRDRLRLTARVGGATTKPDSAAGDPDRTLDPAVNEVVVQAARRGHGGGATATVAVDGEPYFERHADGVIVATPTGSTAYNLSEGGPLLVPDAQGLVVTGMCARDGRPPLVAPADATVTVTLDAPGVAVADGREARRLDPETPVVVARSPASLRVAGPSLDFFGALGKLS